MNGINEGIFKNYTYIFFLLLSAPKIPAYEKEVH